IKHPSTESAEIWLARRRAWHDRFAKSSLEKHQWFVARFHLGQLAQLEPDQLQHRLGHLRTNGELGEWDQAAAELDELLARPDGSPFWYFERALLYLQAKDQEGYRKLCQRMLEEFEKRNDREDINSLVWTAALSRTPPIPAAKLVSLMEQVVARTPAAERRSPVHTLGVALY